MLSTAITLAFTIYRTDSAAYYFKLKTSSGVLLLKGYPQISRRDCEQHIQLIKCFTEGSHLFLYKMTKWTMYTILVKDHDGRMIAKSEPFATTAARQETMNMIKCFVAGAEIYDLS